MIEKIRGAYPRQSHQRDSLITIEEAIRRNHGNAQEILDGTLRIAEAVKGWTSNERLQFLPTPPAFFDADRWMDDPSTWASKVQARLDQQPQRINPDIGGRKPAQVLTTDKS